MCADHLLGLQYKGWYLLVVPPRAKHKFTMSSLKRKRDDGYGYDDGYDDEYRDKTIAKLRLEVEELKSRLESIYCCGCLHEITVCDGCQKSYCYRCLRETTQTNDGVEETVWLCENCDDDY